MASRSALPGGSLHRCMLVLTFALLLCEVAVSRLCNSLINMVDGFHTLFLLVHMALPLPAPLPRLRRTASSRAAGRPDNTPPPLLRAPDVAPVSPPSSPPSPPLSSAPAHSPVGSPPPFASADGRVSPVPSSPLSAPSLPPPGPHPPTGAHCVSPDSNSLSSLPRPACSPPPPSPGCGLAYSQARLRPVGSLISALLLASLCVSVAMEILTHALRPHPPQRPLLATVMGAVSLLHNLLVLGLGWGPPLGGGAGAGRGERRGSLWTNGEVKARDQTKDKPADGQVNDSSNPPTDQGGSSQDGTLVLCNPGTSSVLDPNCLPEPQKPPSSPWADFPEAALLSCPSQLCYGAHTLSLPQPGACSSHSKGPYCEASKPNACAGHSATQTAPTSALQSDQPDSRPRTRCWTPGGLPALFALTQALLGSVLVLANGLALLLPSPGCLYSPEACGLLLYLDPGFSAVAVLVLLATALPQVCRYGLLVLQATPPQLCVSDLGCRISSVPGVQAVHNLHVWQLTESCVVASVHVHCHAGFQAHRCGDLLLGVTKVLQSVGVTCWTVQPEFPLPSSPAANGDLVNNNTAAAAAIPTLIPETFRPLPLHQGCSLACGEGCAGKICCTPREEKTGEPPAPSTGQKEEEPQILVIENTFL